MLKVRFLSNFLEKTLAFIKYVSYLCIVQLKQQPIKKRRHLDKHCNKKNVYNLLQLPGRNV